MARCNPPKAQVFAALLQEFEEALRQEASADGPAEHSADEARRAEEAQRSAEAARHFEEVARRTEHLFEAAKDWWTQ